MKLILLLFFIFASVILIAQNSMIEKSKQEVDQIVKVKELSSFRLKDKKSQYDKFTIGYRLDKNSVIFYSSLIEKGYIVQLTNEGLSEIKRSVDFFQTIENDLYIFKDIEKHIDSLWGIASKVLDIRISFEEAVKDLSFFHNIDSSILRKNKKTLYVPLTFLIGEFVRLRNGGSWEIAFDLFFFTHKLYVTFPQKARFEPLQVSYKMLEDGFNYPELLISDL